MNIGIIDADLLDGGTRHPNLALEKISGYHKSLGSKVILLDNYNNISEYDKVFISKVFDFTKIPIDISQHPNIEIGGTGFFFDKAPDLPNEIEHHMPDYHLYDDYIKDQVNKGVKKEKFTDYINYSIGFATRGCFRKCSYCVNRKYDKAVRHAPIKEFYDPSRKYIYLWDDNVLAYSKWYEVFDELAEINKPFQFRQGVDLRLMTEEKAKIISNSKWQGDFIFAFDNLDDQKLIMSKLDIWKRYCNKTTKLYVLVAHKSQDERDIVEAFERIRILMEYKCLPYIMRYKDYESSEYKGMYITLARWCNQPSFFKKKSFREFCYANGENSSSVRYMLEFEKKHPDIAQKYFDIKY